MMKKHHPGASIRSIALVIVLAAFGVARTRAQALPDSSRFVPVVAVLPFDGRGRQAELEKTGKSVADLIFVGLLENDINLVERADLDKALDELHMSAVGLVSPDSQLQLGRLIGAKILITGSLFEAAGKKYAVAKIIGTETTRVLGCSVSGHGEYTDLAPGLAKKIAAVLHKDSEKLLPRKTTVFAAADRLAEVKGRQRKVFLSVTEDIAMPTPDPAAEIELKKLLLALDFLITDNRAEADFTILCEAVATNAGSYHKFSSAAARVELSVYQGKDKQLIAAGAAKETVAGASYIVAAKDAISQATLRLAADLLKALK
ncbi:MAG: hypothetical protein GX945_14885 [Lentisphaerae bacterium]|nr:hypothetical protein [Lentisphaerota bacterium]